MKLATIEKIDGVFPHPNANSLEFVKVLGFKCIVQKGKYGVGDWCILIQPDTVLPNETWAEFYKKQSPTRVKACKFRGMWSFGIVEDVRLLPQINSSIYEGKISAGHEISKYLGITKYEEPEPVDLNAESGFPYWMRKTGEDMWQSIPIEEYIGQRCDLTLKMDGKSMSIFSNEEKKRICSRKLVFKPDIENEYTRSEKKQSLIGKLNSLQLDIGRKLVFRGELFQGEFYLFGVYGIETRENYGINSDLYFENVGTALDIKTVPIIEKNVILTQELIDKYTNLDKLNGEKFEGIVAVGKDWSFKIINLNYDSKK